MAQLIMHAKKRLRCDRCTGGSGERGSPSSSVAQEVSSTASSDSLIIVAFDTWQSTRVGARSVDG